MRDIDISKHTEQREGMNYLNWAKCIDLLHEHGASKVYFEPLVNEKGSSLFMTDIIFTDSKGGTNRCYEVAVKVVIDENEWIFRSALMNGANPVKDNSMSQQRIWNCQTRLFVKCVAIHTGLGFDLWLKEEKENETTNWEDNLNNHNLFKIKERLQQIYTSKLKKGLSNSDIAKALNKTEDEVKAIFSTFDTIDKFEKELCQL